MIVLGTAPAAAAPSDQWQLDFLHAAEANAISEGDGVVVAVIDTGVDGTHPDLTGTLVSGFDFEAGSGDGSVDLYGHGTGVAGLIVGHGHASGIAPRAKVMPLVASTASNVPKAFDWAVDHGASVITISQSVEDSDVLRAAVSRALAAGIVVVAAAGNVPVDGAVAAPARYGGVIAAGAVSRSGDWASVSVTGPELVLAAPGDEMVSAAPFGGYIPSKGTSNAAPLIAGVAALVKAKFPNLKGPDIYQRLIATADDKGAPGRDPEYGYGIVNPVKALTADVAPATASASPDPGNSTDPASPPADTSGGLPLGFIVVGAAALIIIALVVGLVLTTRRSR